MTAAVMKSRKTGPDARSTTYSPSTISGSATSCTHRGTTAGVTERGGTCPSSGSWRSKSASSRGGLASAGASSSCSSGSLIAARRGRGSSRAAMRESMRRG